jgi:hypothetical protein
VRGERDHRRREEAMPHPAETSAEIAALAPNLEVQKDWRAPTHLAESIRRVTDFLTRHTPAS